MPPVSRVREAPRARFGAAETGNGVDLAKDAGVPLEGSGSHRLAIGGDAGSFTDPDWFEWEAAA
jgi:hypothetical protein